MPINYQIVADVVDIQTDTPKKEDKFFIDTNVWFWMTKRIKTQKVDGYDLFILELMFRHNILQIITDDGDFATIPGIKVFTSNRRVINAAQQQEKILTRWDTQAQPILNQT